MNKYLELCVNTFTGGEEADLDKKMEENSAQLEKYTKLVDDIQTKHMDIFREIHLVLHPPPQREAIIRQPQPHVPMPVSFKPCLDLKPTVL